MDGAALLNTVQIYRKENADMAEETKQTPKLELIRASEIDPKSVEWTGIPSSLTARSRSFRAIPAMAKVLFC